MVIAILTIAINSVAQVTGTFTDSRDGKTYKTVVIGKQAWMAENLAYKTSSGCLAYNNDTTYVVKYGYLYDMETAQLVVPLGWHLPADSEWTSLINYLGGDSIAGSKLKTATGWDGTNESGFTALPAGYSYGDKFNSLGTYASFWSATYNGNTGSWFVFKGAGFSHAPGFYYNKPLGFSVRCVKDN